MDTASLIAFTVALSIAAVIPGPGIAAIVGKALASGFRPGMVMVLGVLSGDIVYLTLAVLGLAVIANTFAGIFLAVKWIGIAYLLYLAWKFWTAAPLAMDANSELSMPRSSWKTYLAGLSVTLGNPKTITFYLALTPTLISIPDLNLAGYAELVVIVFLVLLTVLGAYVLLAAKARATFYSVQSVRRLYRIASGCLAAAAGGLALR